MHSAARPSVRPGVIATAQHLFTANSSRPINGRVDQLGSARSRTPVGRIRPNKRLPCQPREDRPSSPALPRDPPTAPHALRLAVAAITRPSLGNRRLPTLAYRHPCRLLVNLFVGQNGPFRGPGRSTATESSGCPTPEGMEVRSDWMGKSGPNLLTSRLTNERQVCRSRAHLANVHFRWVADASWPHRRLEPSELTRPPSGRPGRLNGAGMEGFNRHGIE
ncbi:unnamed protein product [Protopolystoma xenopodis]|uniref:Uncharacterized protein n=1 Tax=Protopolystoma xenopodis TaxID=117903 RepID=A0A3S5AZ46_9PLAT|nr:unnamed protein product [Protopolystoma xenopodis]